MRRAGRLAVYLVAALVCYFLSAITMVGAGITFVVFLVLGAAFELSFWVGLLRPLRSREDTPARR